MNILQPSPDGPSAQMSEKAGALHRFTTAAGPILAPMSVGSTAAFLGLDDPHSNVPKRAVALYTREGVELVQRFFVELWENAARNAAYSAGKIDDATFTRLEQELPD